MAGGLKSEQGVEPPGPLTLTTGSNNRTQKSQVIQHVGLAEMRQSSIAPRHKRII